MNDQHPIARLLNSTGGLLAIIVTALSIGWAAALWFVQIPESEVVEELDQRVWALERANRSVNDSLSNTADRLVWVICNSVPPNRADVLGALRVSCDYDSRSRRTIRGVPILEEGE